MRRLVSGLRRQGRDDSLQLASSPGANCDSARARLALASAYTASTNPVTAVRTVFCVRAHALAFPPIVPISWVTIARWDESAHGHGSCRSNPFPIGGAWLMSAWRSVRLASLKRAGNEQAATTEAQAKEPGQRQQDQGGLDSSSLATTYAFRERVARVSLVYMVRPGCAVMYDPPGPYGCPNATAVVETGAISFDHDRRVSICQQHRQLYHIPTWGIGGLLSAVQCPAGIVCPPPLWPRARRSDRGWCNICALHVHVLAIVQSQVSSC